MRAVVIDAFGEVPVVRDMPEPVPPPRGVVLEVTATGVCRSDWHAWMGHDDDVRLPHVPGHEMAGVVRAVGAEVRGFRGGERVTLPFMVACGLCPQCAAGQHQVCDQQFQPGFRNPGSFAEYVAIDAADVNLVRLPEGVDDVTAAGLGCRFVTAWRAVVDQGRVGPGQWLAVHGCGGVGLSAEMIAVVMGARVLAVDIEPAKLEFATALGAEATLNAREVNDVPAAVAELTGGGARVSIDALGHPATCAASVACLRKRGRHVQVGLLLAEQSAPPVPMSLVVGRELEIVGSHGMQAHRYPEMLALIEAGRLAPQRLVGRRIALDEAPAALAAMDRFPGVGVTVVDRF